MKCLHPSSSRPRQRSRACLTRQVALPRTQRAPLGLERDRTEATGVEAVANVVQAGDGRDGVAREALFAPTGPPDLGKRGGTRPELRVEVVGVDLLRPQRRLATDNKLLLAVGEVEVRVVVDDLYPSQ